MSEIPFDELSNQINKSDKEISKSSPETGAEEETVLYMRSRWQQVDLALRETDISSLNNLLIFDLNDALPQDLTGDQDDDFVDSLGMDLESDETDPGAAVQEDLAEQAVVSLTPQQLEAALERVIEKMFSEKIEKILSEVIEKTVTREIEKLKNILTDDTSQGV